MSLSMIFIGLYILTRVTSAPVSSEQQKIEDAQAKRLGRIALSIMAILAFAIYLRVSTQ